MSVRSRILGPPVPKTPSGLVEIMDGLARDVLKNNPENIYEFCAHHMQTLLEIRDGRALRPLITLDQKIERAQKLVKQRAEQRQRAYDKSVTDETIKQKILSTTDAPCSADDSELSDKKKYPDNVQTEGIQNDLEKQVLENPAELTHEINETIDKNDVLNKTDHEKIDENAHNENKSTQEILTVKDLDKKEKNNLPTEEKPETNDTVRDDVANNSIENNVSIENPSIVIASDITKAGNDNVPESLPAEADITSLSNDNTEEEAISLIVNDMHLENEGNEIDQNDGETKIQNEVESNIKCTIDEIHSADMIEKIVLSSDNNPEDNIHYRTDTEPCEKQTEAPSTNNCIHDNSAETLYTEINHDVTKQQTDPLSDTRDATTLTVIVVSNSSECDSLLNSAPDTVQLDEIEPVQIDAPESIPNEVYQKSEQNMVSESVPESTHDNDTINNINSSMDLETAAITIQKVFRSFLFKTKTASYDDPTTVDITLLTEDKKKEENEVLNIKERRPLGISRMDTVLQTVNEEKSLSLSTDDSSTLSSAATTIQAHVRGFLVRNQLNLNKTTSSNSLMDSDAPSVPSLEADSDNIKSKTVLNIHIVPEGGHFVSRDESILTSMDLSLDSSPPSSVNLHPLGYDKSERRKQLKREDAIQSVSPPSNNSGKLSEDHDSVKEVLAIESNAGLVEGTLNDEISVERPNIVGKGDNKCVTENYSNIHNPESDAASDEMDVITPFAEDRSSRESDNSTKLLHSGEFHDIVVPTNVSRSETSVVREFQNVLVYFILWNN